MNTIRHVVLPSGDHRFDLLTISFCDAIRFFDPFQAQPSHLKVGRRVRIPA